MPASRLPCQRSSYDIPDEVAYFNCAYMSPQPRVVTDAGLEKLPRKAEKGETRARKGARKASSFSKICARVRKDARKGTCKGEEGKPMHAKGISGKAMLS